MNHSLQARHQASILLQQLAHAFDHDHHLDELLTDNSFLQFHPQVQT